MKKNENEAVGGEGGKSLGFFLSLHEIKIYLFVCMIGFCLFDIGVLVPSRIVLCCDGDSRECIFVHSKQGCVAIIKYGRQRCTPCM